MKKTLAIIICILLVLAITIPTAAITTINVKSIKLDNNQITVKVGESANLKATLTPANTTQTKLTFATANKNVATVNANGAITGIHAGETTITVFTLNKNVFAKCNVKVLLSDLTKNYVTLKILYPGDESARMKDFLAKEFKAKLKADLNLGLEISWSSWNDYWSKKQLMLAAGETIEWYWDGIGNLSKEYAEKRCVPIDDLLAKYGPDIQAKIPAANFKAAMVDGKLQGIPSCYASSASPFQLANVRQDLVKEVGMTDIKSSADLEKLATLVKQKHPDMNIAAFSLLPALAREFSDEPLVFPVDSYILAVGQNTNKVISFYESDTFKKIAKLERSWYLKKFIPDEVTIKYNEKDARMTSGKYVWGEGSIGKAMEITQPLQKNVPTAELKSYLIAPEKPKYIEAPGNECIYFTPTGKYPERAMMFLNWIYKSKDNYDMAIYGVKNKDYTIDNNRINTLTNDTFFYEWMFRNVNYMDFPSYVDDAYIAQYRSWDKDAKIANTFGFTFDSSSVKNEEAKIITEIGKFFTPMGTGFIDYDENIDKALAGLKAAGIDKYRAEYQKQLDAFIAKNK